MSAFAQVAATSAVQRKITSHPHRTCALLTVLFVDSSRCFHFGSRDAVTTRYQMMYAFVSPCRTDFTESFMTPRVFPAYENDSRLRRSAISGAGR